MNQQNSTYVLGAIVVVLLLVIGYMLVQGNGDASQMASSTSATTSVPATTSPAAPATVTTSQTTTTTTKVTYHNATNAQIRVTTPAPGQTVDSSFTVSGEAVGPWYSEAVFPVQVLDKNGAVLAQGQARANGDWMTTSFVPFSAHLNVPESYTGPATLVLMKDNPSGLPANAGSISLPITIK